MDTPLSLPDGTSVLSQLRGPSGSFADSVIAYHTDFPDDFSVDMPMSVANDPLVPVAQFCEIPEEGRFAPPMAQA